MPKKSACISVNPLFTDLQGVLQKNALISKGPIERIIYFCNFSSNLIFEFEIACVYEYRLNMPFILKILFFDFIESFIDHLITLGSFFYRLMRYLKLLECELFCVLRL